MLLTKIIRGVLSFIGGFIGYKASDHYVFLNVIFNEQLNNILVTTGFIIVGILIGWLFGGILGRFFQKLIDVVDEKTATLSIFDIGGTAGGLIAGLVIALLATLPLRVIDITEINLVINVLVFIFLGYLGAFLGYKKRFEVPAGLFHLSSSNSSRPISGMMGGTEEARETILDTSVIVDGRILDIVRTHFITGKLSVPRFVLNELQTIADSEDSMKRSRGRRGLEVLNQLKREENIDIYLVELDYAEIPDVDSKLLKLAKDMGGVVVTNDFNLNRIAELQGVIVLNINDLSNALKPIVLPGEGMHVKVIREGKESEQGVAYLDDGTMVVIEQGIRHIGREVDVVVTSVLQTPAGRMIFTKMKAA